MPYTKEELENNEFYQAIANSARDEYEAEKQFRLDNFNASGSQPGNNLLIRKENFNYWNGLRGRNQKSHVYSCKHIIPSA